MANELKSDIDRLSNFRRNLPLITKKVAQTMLAVTSERIFIQGRDANNQDIGTYSEGYQKTRSRKGLGASKKVTLTFTGQMQSDFSVIQLGSNIGLGFKNNFNSDKAGFAEETYSKEIFAHTPSEEEQAEELFITFTERAL